MTRKDIQIVRMQYATAVHSPEKFITYDHHAGAEGNEIQCFTSFWPPDGFIRDLVNSKIIRIKIRQGLKGPVIKEPDVFAFVFTPLFGYTNQKLEDIFCELFEKYRLCP